ncbi:DUF554 domain-containing protein [Ornithinimicrobium pratense]|uniref:DUF554 domain-containing protein n=1 Tax=Ornithinimicrobium pratense TaxID=2593973 RepID=A0A5J6V6U0_9MICO|nr:DUF554 domain-containing protein [Ornithinimicrobium pratense]QFG68763.1 DUF554 domain-containing protein [Ornithinimicrobium pratense]
MDGAFPGLGTLINIVAVLAGASLGMLAGHRLSAHVRSVVTSCLGLVTLLMAILSALDVTSPALAETVGRGVPILVVLGSLLLGGITGAVLRIEQRLESLAGVVQHWVQRLGRATEGTGEGARERFIEGWLTASLLFCVGPLTILGALSDGLGRGIDQLVLKSALDFFAAMAFASTFGVGVLFSVVSVALIQGTLTLVGLTLGSVVPEANIAALTATGGLLLVGIAFRLLDIKQVPVGDLLPALVFAPVLVSVIAAVT